MNWELLLRHAELVGNDSDCKTFPVPGSCGGTAAPPAAHSCDCSRGVTSPWVQLSLKPKESSSLMSSPARASQKLLCNRVSSAGHSQPWAVSWRSSGGSLHQPLPYPGIPFPFLQPMSCHSIPSLGPLRAPSYQADPCTNTCGFFCLYCILTNTTATYVAVSSLPKLPYPCPYI